jgi:hypothetical protein
VSEEPTTPDRIALRVTSVGEGAFSGVTTRNTAGYIFWFSPRGTVKGEDL